MNSSSPYPNEPPLHRAARIGDDDAIRRLVEGGADIDEPFDLSGGGRLVRWRVATPLMIAAGSSDGATAQTVRLLVDLGASIDPGPKGWSALSFACEGLNRDSPVRDVGRIAVLLAAGSDPNVVGSGGIPASALACVARSGDPERVRLLLAAGADPSPDLRSGLRKFEARRGVQCRQLALHSAAASGSAECVRVLLAAGAPVRDDGAHHSVLADATSMEVLADLLDAGADPHGSGGLHSSIIQKIAANRNITLEERTAMLRALAAVGVDLDEGAPRATAIASHALHGDGDAVEVLLAAGADPGACNALSAACFSHTHNRDARMERTIDLLIAAGFDANDRDADGYTPLHQALSPDAFGDGYKESDDINVAAAAALIRHGASIDIVFPNFDGFGPLHVAALQCSAPAIEVLLAAGADPSQRTPAGETALDIARAQFAEGGAPSAHHDAAACIRALEAAERPS